MAEWRGYTDHHDYGDEWQPRASAESRRRGESMPKPVAFPREAWELRRDLRAYEGEIALLSRTNDALAGELDAAHETIARLRAALAAEQAGRDA